MQFFRAALALCGAASLLAPMHASADDEPHVALFSAAPLGDPPAAWRFATLPRKQPTKFSIAEMGGAHVLKVDADDSYGNLVHGLQVQLGPHATLSWRWRVDQLLADADLKAKSGDDSPAKLCVFFAYDVAKLSLGERTRLSLAHSVSGEEVPSESLCYVWDNKLPVDTGLANAFTKRIRMIVLQSGEGKLGQWVAQKRDIVADYQRLFGDESDGKVPEVIGLAISADADNTHQHALSYFGDVTLTP
ncbi:MAG TPA: DUF3047 domain-containing protein [Burkholderiaceae bacterium]|jgi:hypothetical protein